MPLGHFIYEICDAQLIHLQDFGQRKARHSEPTRKRSKMVATMKILYASLLLSAARASKDTTYYPEGMTNKNVNEKMYWRDANNVVEDLDEFDALYVSFHSCT